MKTPLPLIALIDDWLDERELSFSNFVYMAVFQFGDIYYVRTGYSAHVYDRLQKHISSFPEWPIFIKIFSYNDETVAKRCERYALNLLRPHRTKGDWSLFRSGSHVNDAVWSVTESVRSEFPHPDDANEFSVLDVPKDESYCQYQVATFDGLIRLHPQTRVPLFIPCEEIDDFS